MDHMYRLLHTPFLLVVDLREKAVYCALLTWIPATILNLMSAMSNDPKAL